MYGCASRTIKRAECWRIDAFKLWCWKRLLRVPWTERRSNRSILKEMNPEYSLEELMLNLSVQYLVTWGKKLTHWKRPWCQERLMAGRGRQRMRRLNGITDFHESEQTPGDSVKQGSLVCCSAWGHNELDMTEWLNWNELYPKQMWAKFAVKTVCNNKNPWFQNCLLSTSYQHSTNIQKSKIYRRTNFRNT